jgi:anti-sigma-K factor RskA
MTESGLPPADPGPGDVPPDSIQALTEQIKQTREDVGETIAALAARADFKARARERASVAAGRLRDAADKVKERAAVPRQRWAVLATACVIVFAGALIVRRHRR